MGCPPHPPTEPNTPFPGVNGAAIGADGNLCVTHTGNRSITIIDPETLAVSLVAAHLPVNCAPVGSYPSMALPMAMFVGENEDAYLPAAARELLKLEKGM